MKTRTTYTVQRVAHGFFQSLKGYSCFSEALAHAKRLRGDVRINEQTYRCYQRAWSLSSAAEVWKRPARSKA